ncbi:TNFAIP3-interacting protein 3 isoform X5 [Marmota marmota marmota]|uniref:TNFAIP3-interacting protein 3 isoform X5 n=1 Tax=Marmota marmota marmota TaxID=9994 RepID=UPI00209218E4|nr:TNFAIP3-interacting protein 3 isoform X5 [Marmota marmota marmota]
MKQEGLQACWRDNQTPCGRPVSRDENQDKKLVMLTHQPEDSERCESMELDNKIRDLIERNASLDPKGVPPEATLSHRKACPPKTPRKTASVAHSAQGTAGMSTVDSSADQAESAQSSRRKNLTDPLEQKIRCLEKQRKELLQVNQQWDEQFRSMKELYERKERETLNEELQELKKENKLLKEKNALAMKKKEHYECEIQRLNKALQDVLKIEGASSPGDRRGMCPVECSHAATRTEVEVLKQQVQIYEEDFRKERSDRERLSREKEELRRAHQASRAQLTRLSSQIKVCQMEKEKLEKQLKQIHFPACTCGLAFHLRDPGVPAGPRTTQDQWEHPPGPPRCALDLLPPDGQHNDNGLSSEKKPPK